MRYSKVHIRVVLQLVLVLGLVSELVIVDARARLFEEMTEARHRSRDSEELLLRLCDRLVLGLLSIDFEMVKDERVEVAAGCLA